MDDHHDDVERMVRAEFEERIQRDIAEAAEEIEASYEVTIEAEIDEALAAAWCQADDDARERYRPWIELAVAESTDDIRAKYEPLIQEELRARLQGGHANA